MLKVEMGPPMTGTYSIVYLIHYTGTFNFRLNYTQSTSTASAGSTDIFLLRYDFDGNPIWGSRYGGSNTEFVSDLQTDAFGGLYMAGRATSPTGISFGADLNVSSASGGHFLARPLTSLPPTSAPTLVSTSHPSSLPTATPTLPPSARPTGTPTAAPSGSPTTSPSSSPTSSPSPVSCGIRHARTSLCG